MKRILALILMLCMSVLCFASCASISKFEDKLDDADYEVDTTDDEDDIEDLIEVFDLDYDDYKVKVILYGVFMSRDVFVIKCSSSSNAKKLKSDMNEASAELGQLMGGMEIKAEGSFVILGSDSAAIDAALGK